MHLRPCLAQPLSYSSGFSLVSWDPSPHLGTTLKMPLLGHWLVCGTQEGMQRDISPTFLLQDAAAPPPPEPFSLGYGKQRGVAWDVISQILMHLSMKTEATFWLSGSKQHAVMDLL